MWLKQGGTASVVFGASPQVQELFYFYLRKGWDRNTCLKPLAEFTHRLI